VCLDAGEALGARRLGLAANRGVAGAGPRLVARVAGRADGARVAGRDARTVGTSLARSALRAVEAPPPAAALAVETLGVIVDTPRGALVVAVATDAHSRSARLVAQALRIGRAPDQAEHALATHTACAALRRRDAFGVAAACGALVALAREPAAGRPLGTPRVHAARRDEGALAGLTKGAGRTLEVLGALLVLRGYAAAQRHNEEWDEDER
jgi:hypothetical protein